jgi:hypothetical protein
VPLGLVGAAVAVAAAAAGRLAAAAARSSMADWSCAQRAGGAASISRWITAGTGSQSRSMPPPIGSCRLATSTYVSRQCGHYTRASAPAPTSSSTGCCESRERLRIRGGMNARARSRE